VLLWKNIKIFFGVSLNEFIALSQRKVSSDSEIQLSLVQQKILFARAAWPDSVRSIGYINLAFWSSNILHNHLKFRIYERRSPWLNVSLTGVITKVNQNYIINNSVTYKCNIGTSFVTSEMICSIYDICTGKCHDCIHKIDILF
jgi:hypothetical protein